MVTIIPLAMFIYLYVWTVSSIEEAKNNELEYFLLLATITMILVLYN